MAGASPFAPVQSDARHRTGPVELETGTLQALPADGNGQINGCARATEILIYFVI